MTYQISLPITLDRTKFDSGLVIRDVAVCLFTVVAVFRPASLTPQFSPPNFSSEPSLSVYPSCVHPPIYFEQTFHITFSHSHTYLLSYPLPTSNSQLTPTPPQLSLARSRPPTHPPTHICPKYSIDYRAQCNLFLHPSCVSQSIPPP